MGVTVGTSDWIKKVNEEAKKCIAIRAGLFPNSGKRSSPTSDEIGTFHEYGTKKMPARPFISPSYEKIEDTAQSLMVRAMADYILTAENPSAYKYNRVMMKVGELFTKTARQTIDTMKTPALARSTVRSKLKKYPRNANKLLVASGEMRASISFRPEKADNVKETKDV